MKNLKTMMVLIFITAMPSIAIAEEYKSCIVAEATSLRLFGKINIEEGSLAHTFNNEPLSLDLILADEPIFFTSPSGVSTTNDMIYQWFYNRPLATDATLNEYIVDSFGEIVQLRIQREENLTTIFYTGKNSGNYLTLKCSSK